MSLATTETNLEYIDEHVDLPFDAKASTLALLQQAKEHCDGCRLYKALEVVKNAETQQENDSLLNDLRSIPLVKEIKRKTELCDRILGAVRNSASWSEVSCGSDVVIKYTSNGSGNLHSFMIEAVLDAPVLNVVAVINEVDLYSSWMPGLSHSMQLNSLSMFEKIIYLDYAIPWPLANREFVMEAFGVHLAEKNQLLIAVQSCHDQSKFVLPPRTPRKKKILGEMNMSGYLIEPISASSTKVTMVMDLDPKLDTVPDWLMNFATGKIFRFFLKNMEKNAKFSPTSNYAQRIKKNAELYEFLNQQIKHSKHVE
jgi:hypothetical protein